MIPACLSRMVSAPLKPSRIIKANASGTPEKLLVISASPGRGTFYGGNNVRHVPLGNRGVPAGKRVGGSSKGAFQPYTTDSFVKLRRGFNFPFNPVAPGGSVAYQAYQDGGCIFQAKSVHHSKANQSTVPIQTS